ncbi:hypothetical protein HZC92_06030 [Klebsiella pneumoniae]|uniref:hypothetical protein n=1 Tax=Klebsiella pneumoniae TaxID=573 RepID=UPI001EFDB9FE|nr:hypothetical protein [Klebsiella pneumoniae]MCG8975275.1 hypothetical protein [Klebsiella pneumoniae]
MLDKKTEFKNWFEALENASGYQKIDFDVAIIGCGAYWWFALASFVTLGKQSIPS